MKQLLLLTAFTALLSLSSCGTETVTKESDINDITQNDTTDQNDTGNPNDTLPLIGKWVQVKYLDYKDDILTTEEVYNPADDNWFEAYLMAFTDQFTQFDYFNIDTSSSFDTYGYNYLIKTDTIVEVDIETPNEEPIIWGVYSFSGDTLLITFQEESDGSMFKSIEYFLPYEGAIPPETWKVPIRTARSSSVTVRRSRKK